MNIEIKIDKELQNLLERIATALERVEATEKPQIVPEPEKVVAPEPAPTAEPAAPAQPEAQPSVTLDQIRKMVVTLSAMGQQKKDAVREIITAYGRNVSAIPADKYDEVMDRLTALKKKEV